jgi:hypothetical protein
LERPLSSSGLKWADNDDDGGKLEKNAESGKNPLPIGLIIYSCRVSKVFRGQLSFDD